MTEFSQSFQALITPKRNIENITELAEVVKLFEEYVIEKNAKGLDRIAFDIPEKYKSIRKQSQEEISGNLIKAGLKYREYYYDEYINEKFNGRYIFYKYDHFGFRTESKIETAAGILVGIQKNCQ